MCRGLGYRRFCGLWLGCFWLSLHLLFLKNLRLKGVL
jgi:hypothetical protein